MKRPRLDPRYRASKLSRPDSAIAFFAGELVVVGIAAADVGYAAIGEKNPSAPGSLPWPR